MNKKNEKVEKKNLPKETNKTEAQKSTSIKKKKKVQKQEQRDLKEITDYFA